MQNNLDRPKSRGNDGFVKITENLQRIIDTQGKVCSCHTCERIGDAVIALETPKNMQLEHTDYAFDHLCKVIREIAQQTSLRNRNP